MRVFITARYSGEENKKEVDELCAAVRTAGAEDYCFVRDEEKIDDPKLLWKRAYEEIKKSDLLLIDISDAPTGGRVLEAGIAYALRIPIIIIMKHGTEYKEFFNGIASEISYYTSIQDITPLIRRIIT